MKICSNGHEEVVHEGRWCPVCELQEANRYLEGRISELERELDAALRDLSRAEAELKQ